MYRFYQQKKSDHSPQIVSPFLFSVQQKRFVKRQRCNGKNEKNVTVVTDQDAIQEILVLGGLKDYTCTKPEDCAVFATVKTSGRFFLGIWGLGRWTKSADQKSFSTSCQMKDGCFSNEIRRGRWKMVPKTNTEFTLWKVEGKRTMYIYIYAFLFGDLRNLIGSFCWTSCTF